MDLSKIFKALSDPNRIKILKALQKKSLCVCEIKYLLDITTSTVSSHLSVLKEAGFISDNKNGKWVEYTLNRNSDVLAVDQLLSMLPVWLTQDDMVQLDLGKLENADRSTICS